MAIGIVAHAALRREGGRARVLARLSASVYLTAGGELVWLGGPEAPLHPRAVLAPGAQALGRDDVLLDAGSLAPWRPPSPALGPGSAERLVTSWRDLTAGLGVLGAPRGFGALIAGGPLEFPLARARTSAEALARACTRDDAAAAADAAIELVGLGGGLTPSGDDYVGGVLFARRGLAAAGFADPAAWGRAAGAVLRSARTRTHPISFTLLRDLAAGLGWAPLHELLAALGRAASRDALDAAGRVSRLGHSSGWDLLAGLGAGLGGRGGVQ
ncbi:MAG TPA: DUF2877 domain-containing protein [Methylomirabilota bacterium]|nr:DUF2877 domain-containing protein [Methylomirabilota bacterium]